MRVCCVCTCDQSVKMALRATQLLTNIAVYNFRGTSCSVFIVSGEMLGKELKYLDAE